MAATALGAGRCRIIRAAPTESVLIGLAAHHSHLLALSALTSAIPPDAPVPYYINWDMNWRVIAYIGAVAVCTGLIFGLAPALQAVDGNLHHSLKDGGRGTAASAHRNRMRNLIVIAEIALSLILLVGASLFVRSFLALLRADAGIDTRPLMTMRFFMPGEQYRSPEERARRTDDIVERVERLPGVESAFASNFVALSGGGGYSGIATDLITPEPDGNKGRPTNTSHAPDTWRPLAARFRSIRGQPPLARRHRQSRLCQAVLPDGGYRSAAVQTL
jgi:hypothetical protein